MCTEMATDRRKILFDFFFSFFFGMTKLYTHREMQLLIADSKSGKKNPKTMQQLTYNYSFSLITPLPRWKKHKNVNLAPLEAGKKDYRRWYKKRSRGLDVYKQEISLLAKSPNAPCCGCSFHGREHCPFKRVEGGLCV